MTPRTTTVPSALRLDSNTASHHRGLVRYGSVPGKYVTTMQRPVLPGSERPMRVRGRCASSSPTRPVTQVLALDPPYLPRLRYHSKQLPPDSTTPYSSNALCGCWWLRPQNLVSVHACRGASRQPRGQATGLCSVRAGMPAGIAGVETGAGMLVVVRICLARGLCSSSGANVQHMSKHANAPCTRAGGAAESEEVGRAASAADREHVLSD